MILKTRGCKINIYEHGVRIVLPHSLLMILQQIRKKNIYLASITTYKKNILRKSYTKVYLHKRNCYRTLICFNLTEFR